MLSPIECVKAVVACDNGRDSAGYRRLLHDDYVSFVHGKESTVGAVAEVEALARWWQAASDVHLEPLVMVESGGLVTLRYTLTGTNDGEFFGRPATGRRFHLENCTLLQVQQGRVHRAYRYSDTMGLLGQLGLIPGANA
ncbi:MAG: ester cyclase [Myxococcota bacterium]